jgi:hypothetical protein
MALDSSVTDSQPAPARHHQRMMQKHLRRLRQPFVAAVQRGGDSALRSACLRFSVSGSLLFQQATDGIVLAASISWLIWPGVTRRRGVVDEYQSCASAPLKQRLSPWRTLSAAGATAG